MAGQVRAKRSRLAEGSLPRHKAICEALLKDIASGRIQPGDRLPTEAELGKTFSASRSTIQRAMRELRSRGVLNRPLGGRTRISRASNQIALFTPFARNAAALGFTGSNIHSHLSELASHRGDHLRLQLVSREDGDQLQQMMDAAQALIDQGVSGVFYYPIEVGREHAHYNQVVVDRLTSAGVAVVCVDRDIVSFPDRSQLPLVTFENRRGGYRLTEHILSRGRKRVAFIGTSNISSAAADRLSGYCAALENRDIRVDKALVRLAKLEDLDAAYCDALMRDVRPDAIVCKWDYSAAVVGRHLVSMGVKIGQDVLLAGFDDEPFAELLPVPLTTIRFPAEPFARACYERLVDQMVDPTIPLPGAISIDVELVVRASTGG